MLVDAAEIGPDAAVEVDVCVVGSGIAGTTLATEFDGSPYTVAVLEGGTLDADKDSDLYSGEIVGHPYYNLEHARTRGFGGSANCWGGFCLPFEDFDFEARERIPHSGWPFKLVDVLPYYERAHDICHLGPFEYGLDYWAPRSSRLANPFVGGAVEMAVIQQATFDGATYREPLRQSSNVTVYLDANVVEVMTDDDGRRVVRVRARPIDGPEFSVTARHFVLAAGGIENPRLMLVSTSSAHPQGLGNENDLVGRYFMDHMSVRVGRFHPAIENLSERFFPAWHDAGEATIKARVEINPSIRREEELLRCFFEVSPRTVGLHSEGYESYMYLRRELRHGRRPANLGFHLRSIRDDADLLVQNAWRKRVRRVAGERGAWARAPHPLKVSVEPSPNPVSRVTLADRRDALGVPRARLDWRIADSDFEHIRRSVDLFADDAEASGLGRLELDDADRWPIWGHHHHVGTTRMHANPRHGVVDADGLVHGIENLFVAGSSTFPTAGSGGVTLLIVALSARLADHLKAELA